MAFRDRYNLEPLHVRAHLRTPIIADKWLPLDGVLLYQAHRDKMGPQIASIPGDYSCQGASTLPLGITHLGRRNWYYQCSWAQWSHNVEGKDHWNKRFDSKFAHLVDFGGRRGKVLIEKGRYKAYHMPVFYRAALWVEWWCMGDKAEVEYLLSTVTHIGKKQSQGWGRVSRWQSERCTEDWSTWRDGKLTRGIPAEDACNLGKPFNLMYYGIRPSYWKPSNQKPLAMPDG